MCFHFCAERLRHFSSLSQLWSSIWRIKSRKNQMQTEVHCWVRRPTRLFALLFGVCVSLRLSELSEAHWKHSCSLALAKYCAELLSTVDFQAYMLSGWCFFVCYAVLIKYSHAQFAHIICLSYRTNMLIWILLFVKLVLNSAASSVLFCDAACI